MHVVTLAVECVNAGISHFQKFMLVSLEVSGVYLHIGVSGVLTLIVEVKRSAINIAHVEIDMCRGLALGIALTVYGREEEADTLIEQMTRDQDPILRYGGMYALALAYRGTSNNKAIRQLLHFAVSDVSDDVRRTAVLALGFVLYSEPEQVGLLTPPPKKPPLSLLLNHLFIKS